MTDLTDLINWARGLRFDMARDYDSGEGEWTRDDTFYCEKVNEAADYIEDLQDRLNECGEAYRESVRAAPELQEHNWNRVRKAVYDE